MNSPTHRQESPDESMREVRFEHSRDFASILQQTGISLLVSTYQAGKVAVLGSVEGRLTVSLHNFEQAMGIAIHPDRIAVGTRTQVWLLESTADIASATSPWQGHDACYLARTAHVTDEIHGHEMAWCDDELWVVNTRFSCLCTLSNPYSFVPRWRPPFISQLSAEDRCHLNGLAVHEGAPRYATAMSETDTAGGWRAVKATGGCLIDIRSGETVFRGLSMPHSPRIHADRIWVLDSGRGKLLTVDLDSQQASVVTAQPGYTRGLDFSGPFAFIGLSKIRETSTFGGVPIAEHRESLKCGVAIVDLRRGQHLAHFEFVAGVDEIFDVRVLHGAANPHVSGPLALAEGGQSLWYAPAVHQVPDRLQSMSQQSATGTQTAAGIKTFRSVSEIPARVRALYDRGNQLAEDDDFDQAVEFFQQAVEHEPEFAAAHCNLGVALQFGGRITESITALDRAKELAPKMPAVHMNLAMSRFLNGEFSQAWSEYEWRWKCARFGQRPFAAAEMAPRWKGESLTGKALLVYGEQGVGDEIMFASCLPELIRRAGSCILASEPRLVPLFARSFPNAHVVATDSVTGPHALARFGPLDYQIAAGSVPQYLRSDLTQLPGPAAYLQPDGQARAKWRERLQALGPGVRIGISWRGGGEPVEIRRRSTQLQDWAGVLQERNVQCVNLQYGVSAEDIDRFNRELNLEIHHWPDSDPLRDLDDFAALVSCLDRVISIDNSTVHLAGALGVPTSLLLAFPSSSYWRWLLEGDQSTWYGSLRLHRKAPEQSWADLLDAVV